MIRDFFYNTQKTLNLRGKIINLSSPLVMGIVNLTSDSFFAGSRFTNSLEVLNCAEKMLMQGAHILDIGAASTRPGAKLVKADAEIHILKPLIRDILKHFPHAAISVDTYNSATAIMSVGEGAHIINDVSGGAIDPLMFEAIAKLKVPYVLTHIQGLPENMQDQPKYEEVVRDIAQFFAKKVHNLNLLGVNDIILDPGFGFGKSLEQNYQILNNLDFFKIFELPLMVGLSRKSMIYKPLNVGPESALNGTVALNLLSLLKGANILRVHDVKEAVEMTRIAHIFKQIDKKN